MRDREFLAACRALSKPAREFFLGLEKLAAGTAKFDHQTLVLLEQKERARKRFLVS